MENDNQQQLNDAPMLVGVAVTNPGLYFLAKHWSKVLSLFLLLILTIGSIGVWQYNKFVSKKIDRINKELSEYQDKYKQLSDSYIFIQSEILRTREILDKFNRDIVIIKQENVQIRNKIGTLNTIPQSPDEAQQSLDDIRTDINDKWNNL